MRIGISTLGGAKYGNIIKTLPRKYATKYFWSEFGSAKKQIIADAKSGREVIVIQGLWDKNHNYNSQHRKKSVKIARAVEAIAKAYPKTKFSYTPLCENKHDRGYMEVLLTEIQRVAPSLRLINSPIAGGAWVGKGFVNEIHADSKPPGMPPGEYDFDYDGVHCFDADVGKFKGLYAGAVNFFYWFRQCNLHANKDDKKRDARPTKKLFQSAIFIAENCRCDKKLDSGFIGKSHSDQHDTPTDPRACKFVFVGPKGKKFKKVKLGNLNLIDGGLTEDKRNTWRSNRWGMDLPRCQEVFVDGKSVGFIDPAFRVNEERNKA